LCRKTTYYRFIDVGIPYIEQILVMKSTLSLGMLVMSLWWSEQTVAQTFFVSPTGKDNNPGTAALPLASLAGARDRIRQSRSVGPVKEAVRVVVKDGRYFITDPILFSAQDSGTEVFPVVYTAEKGAKPVFYGGKELKGFEKVDDQLWRVFIPEVAQGKWQFEQLYVNGRRAVRARFPNTGFYKPRAVKEMVITQGPGRVADTAVQKISLYPDQFALLKTLGTEDLKTAVLTFYHKWDNTRKKILKFSVEDTAVYITGKGMKSWNPLNKQTLFTVENVKAGLDTGGEWYLEKEGYLYYKPLPGESIETTVAYAPVVEQFMILKGSSSAGIKNIQFENLSFRVAGYTMPASGNEPMQAAAFVEATVMLDYTANVQFINCEIAHTGSNAIWFRKACANGKIQQCYFHDLGAGAVKIGEIGLTGTQAEITTRITVDNNIMRSGGFVFPCAVALVIFNASDNILTHNEIADFRYSGISAGWSWGYGPSVAKRNKIEFNHIHHLGWGVLSDMGGVYTLGKSEGTSVSNTVIHHIYAETYGGWGLYTDEGSTGIAMENNLVYACKSSAFHQHYGQDNTIRNNIFYNQIRAQLEASRIEPHVGFRFSRNVVSFFRGDLTASRWDSFNLQADSNLYWDSRGKEIMIRKKTFAQWQQEGKDVHSLIADPKFVNADKLDFRMKNKQAVSQIGFKPFDYSKAGVYGSKSWRNLARFNPVLSREFDALVDALEKQPNKK